jgi:chromosome partitioning protein
MRSIGFISAKGGVLKSTTTINLAYGLARAGQSVLVVDSDPQGNASHVLLRGEKPRHPTIADVLLGDADARDAIVPTVFDGVSLLPSDASLADATATLTNEVGRERRLRLALAGVEESFGFVLVDTAPTRSVVTTNVLNYVREIVVPMIPSLFGVLGLAQIQEDVASVSRYLENRSLRISGILLTMTEKNNVQADIERQLREMFGPVVLAAKIPRNVKAEEAHARHESVISYAPKSPASVAYAELTREILSHGLGTKDRHAVDIRDSRADNAA